MRESLIWAPASVEILPTVARRKIQNYFRHELSCRFNNHDHDGLIQRWQLRIVDQPVSPVQTFVVEFFGRTTDDSKENIIIRKALAETGSLSKRNCRNHRTPAP